MPETRPDSASGCIVLGLRSQEALAASGPEHGHQDVSGLPDSPDAILEAVALSMTLRWSETAALPVNLGKMIVGGF